jgi:hypothetical protein
MKMIDNKKKEIQLAFFLSANKERVSAIQKEFISLFNECGEKYDDSPMQLALTGGIILVLLKTTSMPAGEQRKLLQNVMQKIK